ncbi:hypothetical protein CTI12_AA496190 [Artemisia annua]|uniref:Pectinesterase inhibitor domain-containing protein n=1 Tax=Artemisia annua TaxID=35608 RepID=A0A2U1LFP0_ARTAN|nr:hypothetical protein CTI12_AA496190 [Artemisia annua]
MALRRSTLTLIFVYANLFSALCAKRISSLEDVPAPSLPNLGVQKSSVNQNNEAAKVTISWLEGMKTHIESYKTWFVSHKACGLTPPEGKKCCDQCQKNLDDAIGGVKVSVESINKQDFAKANGGIRGIATDIQTCNDCFVKTPSGEDKGAKKLDVWAKKTTDELLLHLKNAENEAKKLSV